MPIGAILSGAQTTAQTYTVIVKYVTGGDLYRYLSAIGDNELQSAQLAVESSKIARNPQAQVLLAVGHLQSAFTAYRNMYEQLYRHNWQVAPHDLKVYTMKARWVAYLMAICYVYLDERELAKVFVKAAMEADDILDKIKEDTSLLGIWGSLRLSQIRKSFWDQEIDDLKIATGNLRRFSQMIESGEIFRQ